jgi:hypothetical protein
MAGVRSVLAGNGHPGGVGRRRVKEAGRGAAPPVLAAASPTHERSGEVDESRSDGEEPPKALQHWRNSPLRWRPLVDVRSVLIVTVLGIDAHANAASFQRQARSFAGPGPTPRRGEGWDPRAAGTPHPHRDLGSAGEHAAGQIRGAGGGDGGRWRSGARSIGWGSRFLPRNRRGRSTGISIRTGSDRGWGRHRGPCWGSERARRRWPRRVRATVLRSSVGVACNPSAGHA